jgi:hypothetical protein
VSEFSGLIFLIKVVVSTIKDQSCGVHYYLIFFIKAVVSTIKEGPIELGVQIHCKPSMHLQVSPPMGKSERAGGVSNEVPAGR